MVDGASVLHGHVFRQSRARASSRLHRLESKLGGAAHFYNTYETKDGLHSRSRRSSRSSHQMFLQKMGLDETRWRAAVSIAHGATVIRIWPALKLELAEKFKEQPRTMVRVLPAAMRM